MSHPANTATKLRPRDLKAMDTPILVAFVKATRDAEIATRHKASKVQSEASRIKRELRWAVKELKRRSA